MEILKFSAEWCAPCRELEKKIKDWKYRDIVKEYDIDEYEDLADRYNITNVPTMVLIDDDGKEIQRFVGNVPLDCLEETLLDLPNQPQS